MSILHATDLQQRALAEIRKIKTTLLALSHNIHRRPELGHRELNAAAKLASFLEENGFQITRGLSRLPTAFLACGKEVKGPVLGFLAEYDALPGIGHGCGHNLIGAASAGAAVVLSHVLPAGVGQIRVIGTPAEETNGGKTILLEEGYFQDLDAAMMFHPGAVNAVNISSLALEALEVTYFGNSRHAALMNCDDGDSLKALLQFFNWFYHWRNSLPDLCQGYGIIIEGGTTPNICPEKTVGRFYLRAPGEGMLDELVEQFSHQAFLAADFTKTRAQVVPFEKRCLPFHANLALGGAFTGNLRRLGVFCPERQVRIHGSMDMGALSQAVPSIHPYIVLEDGSLPLHSAEFARAAGGKSGDALLVLATQALALTGLQFLTDENLRREVKAEHQGWSKELLA